MRPPASTNSLREYTAGSRFLAAKSTRRLCSLKNMGLVNTVRAPARAGHVRESPVEIGGTSPLNELKPHPQRPRRDFCFLQHVPFRAFAGATWLPEDSDPTDPRNGLRELFQTLGDELRAEAGEPRDIAARPRKVGDEPAPNRIGGNNEDNGEDPGRLLGGQGGARGSGHDDINVERNQF